MTFPFSTLEFIAGIFICQMSIRIDLTLIPFFRWLCRICGLGKCNPPSPSHTRVFSQRGLYRRISTATEACCEVRTHSKVGGHRHAMPKSSAATFPTKVTSHRHDTNILSSQREASITRESTQPYDVSSFWCTATLLQSKLQSTLRARFQGESDQNLGA